MSLVMPRLAFPAEGAALPQRLIAHRGVPASFPELSAEGLLAARNAGAPMVEIDVRPTGDGVLVVHHDEELTRLFGDEGRLSDLSLAEARARAERARGEGSLLTLDEALALTVPRMALDIEIKPVEAGQEASVATSVVEALVRAGTPRNVIATSECEEILKAMRAAAPTLPTGFVFRSMDTRDSVETAQRVTASVIIANAGRVEPGLVARARAADLSLWSYVAKDIAHARQLLALGCDALFVDDWPAFEDACRGPSASRRSPDDVLLLAIDLGSSSTKAALVSPREGIVAKRARPTPYLSRSQERVEIDARELFHVVETMLEELADECAVVPHAAALASQRSMGLWARPETREALTPALSWRDPRGDDVVDALSSRRDELEAHAGLPLARAWTAIRGRILAQEHALDERRVLIPLGSWIAAALTGGRFDVDPGLANRTFLANAEGDAWDPLLLEAFAYEPGMLPPILPTVHPRGALTWPGGGELPLLCVGGDQQCAYVGAAGPTESRLVANLGTGSFVMRLELPGTPLPAGARRAPLWTSTSRPRPRLFLVELALVECSETRARGVTTEAALRAIARSASEEPGSLRAQARALGEALERIALPRDQSIVLTGGGAASPHLVEVLRKGLQLPTYVAREAETTLLGAARLAAAGARLAWSIPPAGGLDQEAVLPQ